MAFTSWQDFDLYLHALNMVNPTLCVSYGCDFENLNILIINCPKINDIWTRDNVYIGFNIKFRGSITDGCCWNPQDCRNPSKTACIMAVVVFLIWKAQCDVIFKGIQSNFARITGRAIDHVKDDRVLQKERESIVLINHVYMYI